MPAVASSVTTGLVPVSCSALPVSAAMAAPLAGPVPARRRLLSGKVPARSLFAVTVPAAAVRPVRNSTALVAPGTAMTDDCQFALCDHASAAPVVAFDQMYGPGRIVKLSNCASAVF